MKNFRLLIASMVLTCFALIPVVSLADEDLEVTMDVIDNLSQVEGVIIQMTAAKGDDEGGHDGEDGGDDHDGDQGDDEHDGEVGGDGHDGEEGGDSGDEFGHEGDDGFEYDNEGESHDGDMESPPSSRSLRAWSPGLSAACCYRHLIFRSRLRASLESRWRSKSPAL